MITRAIGRIFATRKLPVIMARANKEHEQQKGRYTDCDSLGITRLIWPDHCPLGFLSPGFPANCHRPKGDEGAARFWLVDLLHMPLAVNYDD